MCPMFLNFISLWYNTKLMSSIYMKDELWCSFVYVMWIHVYNAFINVSLWWNTKIYCRLYERWTFIKILPFTNMDIYLLYLNCRYTIYRLSFKKNTNGNIQLWCIIARSTNLGLQLWSGRIITCIIYVPDTCSAMAQSLRLTIVEFDTNLQPATNNHHPDSKSPTN